MSEGYKKPETAEAREAAIDGLISSLAEREGMTSDEILCDIIVFAPYDGNESANHEYLEEVAEKLGISTEEMIRYAVKKAQDSGAAPISQKPAEIPELQHETRDYREPQDAAFVALAIELSKNPEPFPFPGIKPELYVRLKKDRDDFPELFTPLDELIGRLQQQGMKIALNKRSETYDLSVMPYGSTSLDYDGIPLKVLETERISDARLKELIGQINK